MKSVIKIGRSNAIILGGCVMLDKKKSMRGYMQDRRLQWFGHLEGTFVVGDSFNKDD